MSNIQSHYDAPAGRFMEILVGLLALVGGAGGVYLGARGWLAYAAGSRASSAHPLATTVGLVGGIVVLWLAARMLRGASTDAPLLPQGLLLIGSLLALTGAGGIIVLATSLGGVTARDGQAVLAFGGMGVFGLTLWRRRRRRDAA